MKKHIFLVSALAAVLFSGASCSREIIKPSDFSASDIILEASLEVPQDESRTSISSTGVVIWSSGDSFALMSSTAKVKYTILDGENTASGRFSGPAISDEGPYYALYPYSDECSCDGKTVSFALPQTQKYVASNIATGASPALANLQNVADAVSFRNLCGILKLQLSGQSENVAKIAVVDLAGNSLWGNCSLTLDGKQGTAEQKMEITGGSNILYMTLPDATKLTATAKVVNFIVPANTLTDGFSVILYDKNGAAVSFLTAQNEGVKIARSMITPMNSVKVPKNGEPLDTLARGYYMEVFMEGGVSLTSRTTLPAVPFLGWNMEYLATSTQAIQDYVIISNELDANGSLLYPDGEPRYRMIYMNGGQSNSHGKSLGETGRQRIIDFVTHGGGYVGTCAGALIASQGYDSYATTEEYLHIWPGHVTHTGLSDSYTGMFVEPSSPLLKYYNFGGDMYIDSVRHNGGCFMDEKNTTYPMPAGTEILLRYDRSDRTKFHKKVSCWAYKPNELEGRRVMTGSHPEGIESGERREMMAGMMRYATDGNGIVTTKGELPNGYARMMDNNAVPGYEKIGDCQYHHFFINIPAGSSDLTVELSSEYTGNLHLALRKTNFAWRSDADYLLVQKGSSKKLHISNIEPGIWYVSVYCPDKPTATLTSSSYYTYSGNTEPLNGVAYSIKTTWKENTPSVPSDGNEDYPIVVL